MRLYELVLDHRRSVSPFVWRARMALAHKGFHPERIGIGYGGKDRLAFSGQDRVPVLVDGDTVVSDSWRIACHLEDAYPQAPSLFGGEAGRPLARFVNHWCDTRQLACLFVLCTPATFDLTPEPDKAYFRESRFAWSGRTIEEMRDAAPAWRKRLHDTLAPLRALLSEQDFLGGAAPTYADYCVFGGFMWARVTVGGLLEPDDPVERWRQAMLDLFDGFARKAPCAEAPAPA